jgi:transcriptional regulator with XRE-family HTH domain
MADAGITLAGLAREAGVPYQQLWQMMAGHAKPTIETYAKLAVPLGADLSTRFYPNTGPLIRDRHQARIAEALLPQLHPRWRCTTEVGVRQPARGWIDLVLHERLEAVIVAVEIESDIRRIEQQVRWAKMKAESLPSSVAWPRDGDGAGEPPRISQILIVRRTRSARATSLQFSAQLALAYPAHPEDALAALTGTKSWPGPALLWVELLPERVRFLPTR